MRIIAACPRGMMKSTRKKEARALPGYFLVAIIGKPVYFLCFRIFLLEVETDSGQETGAVGQRTVEIIIVRLVVQKVVDGKRELHIFAKLLHNLEFPERISGIIHGDGSLRDIIIVAIFHIFHP